MAADDEADAWLARTPASWEAFEIAAVKDAEIQSCPVFISKRGFEVVDRQV